MIDVADTSTFVRQVVDALHRVTGPGNVLLHEPTFAGNEWQYLKECLDSTFVSSVGKFVDRFESELAAYTGAQRAVAVVNGTAALHVALRLAGVRPGDEVIVPTLTFAATAAAVTYCGATPHFADSEARTLGIDPLALREYLADSTEVRAGQCINRATGNVIRALVPMHTFGHPVDIEAMLRVAADFRLALVEDAAESLGSTVEGRHTGTFGLLGTLSFNGNKTITTGGGGAIITNDLELARQAKHITTTAKVPHPWEFIHDQVGFNYRMPNINAALGCAQLEQLDGLIASKRRLYSRYAAAVADIPGVQMMHEPAGCVSNYWLQCLLLDEDIAGSRDDILAATNGSGLSTRPVWMPMHLLEPYRTCPRMDLTVAESLARCVINVPSSPGLA